MTRTSSTFEALLTGATGDFLGLGKEHCDPASSRILILPVPFDGSSSWLKGADRGPAALLQASREVELYDMETHCEVHRLGIATLPPLAGPPGQDPAELAGEVEAVVAAMLEAGRFPVLLGGEHSISIGAIRAAQRAVPELTILQVDAHADTRETYLGSPCNHACVMARAREGGPVIQVGIRSMDATELAKMDVDRVHPAHRIHEDPDWLERIRPQLGRKTWITFDLDALDSSQMPATGTPEPGGLLWPQVMQLLRLVCRHSDVVGLDLVELKPIDGFEAPDFLAARLLQRMLSQVFAGEVACQLPGTPPFQL